MPLSCSLAPPVAAVGAGSWARSCCVRPSRRPLRCCSCSSCACWPPSLCFTSVAQNGPLLATCSCAGCWLVLMPRRHGLLDRDVRDPVQLDHRARLHLQVGGSLLAQPARGLAAPAGVACSASRFGRLELHVENGHLEIFRSVCGSSTPASSCQARRAAPADERCCRCCAAGRVARVRLLVVASW